ncbi:hypothetical protein L248_0328 [Schleiferilactobacillus shenzhenensis LY-73]|uniref:Uncharacterized protein n=1 Tax=Schleiferilactobacillus shenzhenensis LY-73 TaxID=1231336 RepID=U4TQY9_9LACO|nr:hypothetical protein L248_0328 [Schleiferilactobacillus shenzhenensis LY-73]
MTIRFFLMSKFAADAKTGMYYWCFSPRRFLASPAIASWTATMAPMAKNSSSNHIMV